MRCVLYISYNILTAGVEVEIIDINTWWCRELKCHKFASNVC